MGDHRSFAGGRGSGTSKAIALVSGKGGSGKTMIAVAIAQGVSISGRRAMLIDADFGTGGLTYYLSFRVFSGLRFGLTDLIDRPEMAGSIDDWAGRPDQSNNGPDLDEVRLIPIGSGRRLREDIDEDMVSAIDVAIQYAKQLADVIIVDCRGGFDYQSLAVCSSVDEILLVVETDSTSIRASQHLVEEMKEHGIKEKIAGFVLNKVIDDPTTLAMTANSLMQIEYLGAIPFDIEATRSYIQGRVAPYSSLFVRHVMAFSAKVIPELRSSVGRISILKPDDYSKVTLGRPELRIGNFVIASAFIYASLAAVASLYLINASIQTVPKAEVAIGLAAANLAVIAMLSDVFKQLVGRIFQRYNVAFRNIFGLRRS